MLGERRSVCTGKPGGLVLIDVLRNSDCQFPEPQSGLVGTAVEIRLSGGTHNPGLRKFWKDLGYMCDDHDSRG